MTRAPNISGAMLAMTHSIIASSWRAWRIAAATFFGGGALCLALGSSIRPARKAKRLISSEMPQREKGEADREQHFHRPADESARIGRILLDVVGLGDQRQRQPQTRMTMGRRKNRVPTMSMTAWPGRELAGQDVDADVFVFCRGVGRAEEKDGGEEVPLDFQWKAVRTVVEHETQRWR